MAKKSKRKQAAPTKQRVKRKPENKPEDLSAATLASALAKKKWEQQTPAERSEHARRMSLARWRKTPRKEE